MVRQVFTFAELLYQYGTHFFLFQTAKIQHFSETTKSFQKKSYLCILFQKIKQFLCVKSAYFLFLWRWGFL
jgi:hypothetical protein